MHPCKWELGTRDNSCDNACNGQQIAFSPNIGAKLHFDSEKNTFFVFITLSRCSFVALLLKLHISVLNRITVSHITFNRIVVYHSHITYFQQNHSVHYCSQITLNIITVYHTVYTLLSTELQCTFHTLQLTIVGHRYF